jgi:hypothetical protein
MLRISFLHRPSDADQLTKTIMDLLHMPIGSITRSKAKALEEALNEFVL